MRSLLLAALLLAGAAQAQTTQVQTTQVQTTQVQTEQERAAAHAAAQMATLGATEEPTVLPDGEGRDDVFYGCTACHGSAVIRRSRLSRAGWDGLMDWMVERHGMAPLEGSDRTLVVDYLARHFGPAQGGAIPARGRNPFLN